MVDHSMMKLGKGRAKHDDRTLLLSNYTSNLAPAPDECNLTSKITNLGMMANDRLGDCTCATIGHIIQQDTAENGHEVILTDDQIIAVYSAITGYNPADPSTDQGAVELDVLNYWRTNGVEGHILSAYAAIVPHKIQELKDSVYYFGNCYLGIQLPVSAQTQDIWDVASGENGEPGSWGGHAVPAAAYDKDYVYVITWGQIKKMTWAFFVKYCDEAYACLSQDWVCATSKCPEGFDLACLQSDLRAIVAA